MPPANIADRNSLESIAPFVEREYQREFLRILRGSSDVLLDAAEEMMLACPADTSYLVSNFNFGEDSLDWNASNDAFSRGRGGSTKSASMSRRKIINENNAKRIINRFRHAPFKELVLRRKLRLGIANRVPYLQYVDRGSRAFTERIARHTVSRLGSLSRGFL